MKENIIEFYKNATLYEKLTSLSYEKKAFHKRYMFDFIDLENIEIKENKIIIKVNKQLQMFLLNDKGKNKGISTIRYIKNKNISKKERIELEEIIEQELFELGLKEGTKEFDIGKNQLELHYGLKIEKNRLLFSPVYIKVNFIEEDSTVFIPVITFDITDEKENIKNHNYKENPYELTIDLENTEFNYNNFVTNLFMKDTFKEIQNSILYIANTENILSTKELFQKIYKNLSEHLEDIDHEIFEIEFPNFEKEKEPIGLFFNQEDNIEVEENYEYLKKSNSKLLDKYLTIKTEENHKYELQNNPFYGSLTDQFPLGQGQAIVMEKNQENQELVSVIGPPGSGKTTLFLSIVANNVVKRAMANIFENRDYNNLMLVTSTSNKAVENVYKEFKDKFKVGFCYIGGNFENRKHSAEEITKLIEYLRNTDYREGSLEQVEEKIKKIVKVIETTKERYIETKTLFKEEFGITEPDHIKYLKLEKIPERKVEEANDFLEEIDEIVKDISKIIEKEIKLNDVMDFINSSEYKVLITTARKLGDMNFFFELIGLDKHYLNKFSLRNKDFEIKEKEFLIHLAEYLQTIRKYKYEIEKYQEIVKEDKKIKSIQSIEQNFLKKVLSFDSFGEYFRNNLYKINYELFILSKRYLEQKALKNKYSTIEALEFLASGDMYSVRNPKEFLENVSRIYPVVTSTIAGFKYMFRNLNSEEVYESVLADEAGMIKVQDLLSILVKSKRAIIIGDPKQLPPIVTMHFLFEKYLRNKTSNDEFFNMYSPTQVSAYHRAAGTIEGGYKATGYGIMLDEHRRCQKPIAELFIKVAEYDGVKIKTPQKDIKLLEPFKSNLLFFNVIDRDKKDSHINEKEIEAIKKILDILDKSENFDIETDVGIITPYTKQEQRLIEELGSRIDHTKDSKKIGTVHKFQGVEFKVIIFSPVVSKEEDSLKFINKDPSMVNVSISRAKDLFIVIGDYNKLSGTESGNYIGRMTELMKDNLTSVDDLNFI